MVDAYRSADSKLLFIFALVIVAPLFEELLFRGFLFAGIANSRLGVMGAAALTSIIWAAIHFQYDLYGVFTIVIAGFVLSVARVKTNSLIVPMLMHALQNSVATLEVIIYLS